MRESYCVDIITHRRFRFKSFPGFKQKSPRKYIAYGLTKKEAIRYVWRARLFGYKAYYFEPHWNRGSAYRRDWIDKQGEECRCVYCGRKFPTNSITVDHVVPVSLSKRSKIARAWLKSRGFKNIDDERNLVPACYQCNHLKKDSTNIIWFFRAYLGKYTWWWVCVWMFRIVVVLLFILLIIYSISKAR